MMPSWYQPARIHEMPPGKSSRQALCLYAVVGPGFNQCLGRLTVRGAPGDAFDIDARDADVFQLPVAHCAQVAARPFCRSPLREPGIEPRRRRAESMLREAQEACEPIQRGSRGMAA